jgi:hypothetical protein
MSHRLSDIIVLILQFNMIMTMLQVANQSTCVAEQTQNLEHGPIVDGE